MGIADSAGLRNWITDMDGYVRMTYPGGLDWGAVFIAVGPPKDPPRLGQDLAAYNTLSLELRGATGTECVRIGLKDNTDPDNGSEMKIRCCVNSTDWEPFTFPLAELHTADLTRLYVVTEFVFEQEDAQRQQTVDFKNIEYLFLAP